MMTLLSYASFYQLWYVYCELEQVLLDGVLVSFFLITLLFIFTILTRLFFMLDIAWFMNTSIS